MQKKYIHLLISLIIIILSLFFAFKGVKIVELENAFASVQYRFLPLAMIIVIFTYFLRALRWRYLLRPVKEVKMMSLFSSLMIGFMANMLPARTGEFVRAYMLSRKEKINFSASFASIFIERVFDLALVLLLLVSALLIAPDAFDAGDSGGTYQLLDKARLFGKVSVVLCLFIFLFSALLQFKNDLAMKIVSKVVNPLPEKWRGKVLGFVTSFTDGLVILRDKRGFIVVTALSFLVWASLLLTYYPMYYAFNIEGELPIISSIIILSVTVSIFITLAPTPGFLGSFHLACVAVLHGIFSIQKAVALSYGIMTWLVSMGLTVLVGAIFAVKENISLSEFKENVQV